METVLFIPQVQIGSAPTVAKSRRAPAWLIAAFVFGAVCLTSVFIGPFIRQYLWKPDKQSFGLYDFGLDAEGQYTLGYANQDGEGGEKDQTEAFNWYLKAAYNGSERAQWMLGGIYLNAGLDSPENRIEAHKWYSLVAKQGNGTNVDKFATNSIKGLERLMSAQELAEAERRTHAVLTGEPPPTRTMPLPSGVPLGKSEDLIDSIFKIMPLPAEAPVRKPEAPVRPTTEPERTEFEVVSLTTKVMEENDSWWRWSYQLKVRNNTAQSIHKFPRILFLDAEGFIIKEHTCEVQLSPGETRTFLDTTLVDVPGAARVKTIKAEVR